LAWQPSLISLGLAGLFSVALIVGPADLLQVREKLVPRWCSNFCALPRLFAGYVFRRLLVIVGHAVRLPLGHPLGGAARKIERAEAHRQELGREIASFIESEPYAIRRERETKRKKYVLREILEVRRDPPPELSLIIGDCLHNLRCALDYLAYELARLEQGKKVALTHFPIYSDWRDYRLARQEDRSRVEYLNRRHRAVINRLQPYRRRHEPRNDPLAILARLDNRDKHRSLQLMYAWLKPHETYVVPKQDISRILKSEPFPGGRVEDGTILVTNHVIPSGPNPDVYVSGVGSIDIALSEGLDEGRAIVPAILEIGRHVQAIVEWFGPVFPR
jgi:hypothetical protein